MVIQTITTNGCPQTIVIGRRGTYDTLQITFDLRYLVETYGNGVAVLAVKRSQDESAYPAVVTQAEDVLTWTVSETDTAYVGAGECQLMWFVDGGLAKTIIYPMVVMRDILSTSEEPPDGYENWVESLIAEGSETLQNAQDAAQSASDAEDAKDDAVAAKEAAEAALEEFTTPTASATTLAAGSQATAEYSDGNFAFGIPRGADGSPGTPGAPGADGVTPDFSIGTVTTLEPTQPATATITGTPEAPVLNLGIPKGAKGDPGQGGGSVDSVNGQTGDVVLDAGDLEFDDSETYAAGSIGAEVSQQKNAIDQKQTAPSSAGTAGQVLGLDSNLDPVWVNQSGGGGKRLLGEVVVQNGVLIYPQSIDLETGIVTFSDLSNIPESISVYSSMMVLTKLDKAAPINTLPTELVSSTLGIHKISDTTAYLRASGSTDITSYASSQTIDLTKWAFEVYAIGVPSIQVSGLELKNHMYFELYSPATQQEDVSMSLRLVDSNGTQYLRAGSGDGFRPYYGGDAYSMLSYRTMPVTNGGKAGITFTGIWLPAWYKLDVRKKDDFILVESDTSVAVENSAANAGRYVRDIQSFVLANNGISAIAAYAANSFGAFPGGSYLRVWEVLD